MQLNSLKRYLRLQALPSLQDAYALPDSPHHIATITSSMHKMQLASPTAHAAVSPSFRSKSPVSIVDSPALQSQLPAASSGGTHRQRAHTSLGFHSAEVAAHDTYLIGARSTTPFAVRAGIKGGSRSPKRGWDDSGIQRMQSNLSRNVDDRQEERYWEQQDRLLLENQQQQRYRSHLAW